ncbi:MAG: SusC/RagA family TonB-linked outer membrane protein [Cyclobacteriaceae bacterium]
MKNLYKIKLRIVMVAVLLITSASVWAQERVISGAVKDENGASMPGVNILVKGTANGTVSDGDGNFKVGVPDSDAILVFTFVGYATSEIIVGSKSVVNVQLTPDVQTLSELVVTGYAVQEKKDITGSVSVIKASDLVAVKTSDFAGQLAGRAPGVTVGTSGQPGAAVNVRIRGISTFGNNDPLYVIDGVPTQGAYQNSFNANDIESIQILKDAAASSIYGSRAGNGVVIITTKKGKAGATKVEYNGYSGVQSITKTLDLLNPTEYAQATWASFQNFGRTPPKAQYGSGASPVLPDYIFPSGAFVGDPKVDPSNYSINIDAPDFNSGKNPKYNITPANKEGTNWWNEVFAPASIQEHNISIGGGSDKSRFNVSANYFDQKGIMQFTNYSRYTLRANSEFTVKKNIKIGENLQVSYVSNVSPPGGNQTEGSVVSNILKTQSIVPVYDIAGNFAGSKGAGLGNGSNPYAQLYRNKENKRQDVRMFGNIYGEFRFLKDFTARTSIGVDYGAGYWFNFNPRTVENAEPTTSNNYNENASYNANWTWTNTVTYDKTLGDHTIKAFVGYESVYNSGRGITGGRSNYFTDAQSAWGLNGLADAKSQTNSSYYYVNTLASVFGRADYSYKDKYLLSATIRRDGSSNFGPNVRYAVFPAGSIGWRISQESFLQSAKFLDDLKIRIGWGQTGNQNINGGNAFSTYAGGANFANYDLNGTSNSAQTGFAPNSVGNVNTKWETTTQTNLGVDAAFFGGKLDVTVDVYTRATKDLLYQARFSGTAGLVSPPFINVGSMENKGIDIGINYKGEITNDLRYNIGFNISHYKNTVTSVDGISNGFFTGGGSRFGDISRSQVGSSISQFYGYKIGGIFQNAADITAWADQTGATGSAGVAPGKFKFVDVNGDNKVDGKDLTLIGNPHPKFTFGLNVGLNYKNFDFTMFIMGKIGNDLYNYNKWFTDFNSFQGNRSKDFLYNSWTPERPNAKLPILDSNDNVSNGFSHSYYVEDGSFVRARTISLGYTIPSSALGKIGIERLRIYVQGQNLFTITNYSGLDPDISQQGTGNNSDQTIGIDFGNYPVARTIMGGLSLTF